MSLSNCFNNSAHVFKTKFSNNVHFFFVILLTYLAIIKIKKKQNKNKLEALRERRPPWPRQIITPILSTVKMLSLGCERLPTHPKKKKRFWIITFTAIWVCYHYYGVFFAHLLILQYPDHHQNLISSYLYYSGPVHKISSQSVHNFLSNVVHRQTDKQTNRQTDRQTNQRYQKHNLLCQGGKKPKLFSQPQFVCNPLGNSIYMPVLVLAFLDQGCFKAKNCVCMSAMIKRISASALYVGFLA